MRPGQKGHADDVALLDANEENLSGNDFLRVLVRTLMSEQRSSSVKRPLTAAFRGVTRDRAVGSYLVNTLLM